MVLLEKYAVMWKQGKPSRAFIPSKVPDFWHLRSFWWRSWKWAHT